MSADRPTSERPQGGAAMPPQFGFDRAKARTAPPDDFHSQREDSSHTTQSPVATPKPKGLSSSGSQVPPLQQPLAPVRQDKPSEPTSDNVNIPVQTPNLPAEISSDNVTISQPLPAEKPSSEGEGSPSFRLVFHGMSIYVLTGLELTAKLGVT